MNASARHLCNEIIQAAMGEHGLTPAEIQSILDDIEIDSSIGMNWDVIAVWIDDARRACQSRTATPTPAFLRGENPLRQPELPRRNAIPAALLPGLRAERIIY